MTHSRNLTYTLHKLSFLLDKLADRALQGELDLSFSQFRVLIAINRNSEVTQKKIACFWDMTQAAVSRQIELLIEKKLVAMHDNVRNRREHHLSLTAQGKDVLEKAYSLLDSQYEPIFKVISQDDRAVFEDIVHRLLGELCENGRDFCCDPKK